MNTIPECCVALGNAYLDIGQPDPECQLCIDSGATEPEPTPGAVNECSTNMNNCSVDALCTDLDNGFQCTCNEGFAGDGVTCTGKHAHATVYNSTCTCTCSDTNRS